MRNNVWCSFHGVTSDEVGYRLVRIPNRPMAELKATAQSVPGRNGDLIISEDAYKDIEIQATFEATSNANHKAFGAWLSGAGDLYFSDMQFEVPGSETLNAYAYTARVIRAVNNTRGNFLDGHDAYTVTFKCHPLRHLLTEASIDISERAGEGAVFTGDGNVASRPLITVYGSGEGTLMVNEYSILISSIGGHITIDSDSMMAFRDGTNVSSLITIISDDDHEDDFPQLYPDTNLVNWSGGIAAGEDNPAVSIIPHWRWR